MKKGFLLLAGAAIFATTSLVSCSKDDDGGSLELTNANVAGTYKMTGNVGKASTSAGGSQTTDYLAQYDACEKDDTYQFSTAGVVTETDAGTTCTSSPTPTTYNYSVSQTAKTITVDGETYNVDNLTSTQLIVSQTETYTQSGITFTNKITVTFTK